MMQGNRLQKEFYNACKSGDIKAVELLLAGGADINQAMQGGRAPLYVACQNGHSEIAELLLARGADINQARRDSKTPLSISCELGHLAISELLILSNKLNGYTPEHLKDIITSCEVGHLAISELLILSNKLNGYIPEHLKDIITSCADDRHRPRGRANATSYSIIAYRCYKQLQSIDPSYIPDDRESTFIGYGRAQQERQTHTLLSLFFDNRKKRAENVLPEEVWRKATTYLPLSWLKNDDNTTTHQSLVS